MLHRLALPIVGLCSIVGSLHAQGAEVVDRAASLFEEERYTEARQLLVPYATAHPRDARAAYELGRAYLGEDDHDQAIAWLEKAVRLDPNRSDYHLWLGNAYGDLAEDVNPVRQAMLARKVKAEFERAVALDPNSVRAHYGLVQFHTLAPSVMGGNRELARRHAEEVRRRNPYMGAMAMAMVHRSEKNLAGATAEFEAALRQYPDSMTLRLTLSNTYEQQKRFADQRALWESQLRRRPNDMAAVYQIGRVGAVSGERLQEAEAALRRYLQHTPRPNEPPHAAARWRLGMIYEKQGKPDQARVEYRAALALDPKHKEARAALKKLGG